MLLDYLKTSMLMMKMRPVRAALSLLGIYIGVAALAVILSIREGIRHDIRDLYRTEGAQVVFVYPGFDQATQRIGHLSMDDLQALKETPGVLEAVPRIVTESDAQTSAGTQHVHIVGIDANFASVFRVAVLRGRMFIPQEVLTRQPVCLLTSDMATKLFPRQDPRGQNIEMQGRSYEVIGIVRWGLDVSQRSSVSDADVFVPYPWLVGDDQQFITLADVRLRLDIPSGSALHTVQNILTHGRPEREATFIIRSMDEYSRKNEEGSDKILRALMAIAGISLLVGGVGVANVMVTNVTERTREVGIRKALGARHRDILLQFLVESSVLAGSGGLLAVGSGVLAMISLQTVIHFPFPMEPTFVSMASCVLLTLLIGVLAGVYPASRAAALSPADALRYE